MPPLPANPPSRRRLLRWTLAGGAWMAGAAARADDELLQETDEAAISFAYRADAAHVDASKNPRFKPGQRCANCALYAGDPGQPQGGCQVFLGKAVSAKGWCNAWEKKAS